MKLKLKLISILVLIGILLLPFTLNAQKKNIINLSNEEISNWLGIDDNSSSSSSSNNNSGNSTVTTNSNSEYTDENLNGDEKAYSTYIYNMSMSTEEDGSPRKNQDIKRTQENPFFKGINQITPQMNDYIKSYIDYFKTDTTGKEWIEKSLRHFEFYFPVFRSQLKFEGLPLELMVIPFIETGYNNEVVIDPKKAGLWQLTEELAKNYNLEIDDYVDERKDFERATTAAILELKRLNNKMNDWNLTIMAWALGEKEITKLVNEYRTRNCWKLYELGAFGNSKKKAFLAHFYALLDIIVNAEYYGFKPPRFVKGIPYFRVIINKAVELKRMEQDLRLVDDILYAYNPQLKLKMTPPNYKNFLLKFPADQSLKREFEVQASIYNNMPDNVVKYEPKQNIMEKAGVIQGETPNELLGFKDDYEDYKVKKNKNLDIDTPYSEEELEEEIVENYKNEYAFDKERAVTSSEDYSYNINIKNDNKKASEKNTQKQSNNAIKYDESEYVIDYDFYDTEKITTQTKISNDDIIYKIKYGDTLWGLYKKFGVPYQVIAYYNGIKNPDVIYADDVIKIPSEKKIDNLIAKMESNKNKLGENTIINSKNNNENSKTVKDVDVFYEEEKIDADYNISDSEIGYLIYVVRKGDTLISIANKFNITIKQISVSNPDLSIKILPGQKIRIPLFS